MALFGPVSERFWEMENRFWIVFDPDFKVKELDLPGDTVVIGFMAKEELCCDTAELQMEHPSEEIDVKKLVTILQDEDEVFLLDLHTRHSVLMTRRDD